MKILGIDPGVTFGWAFASDGKWEECGAEKTTSLVNLEVFFLRLVRLWHPDALVLCESRCSSMANASRHGAFAGIVELVCEKHGVPYFARPDNTMRRDILGKGNFPKEEIRKLYGTKTDHESDAIVAALWGGKYLRIGG